MKKVKVGKPAPELTLPDQKGRMRSLEEFRGSKLIIYFYPQDDTPTCTTQACNLRDNYKRLLKNGFKIIGISPDKPAKHLKFISKFKLPFDLLADSELEAAKAFGVWGEKTTFGRTYIGLIRTTFLLDENGIVTEIIKDVKSKVHSDQILKDVQ